jgi:nucleoside-diphosphate-sugar epimerase
MRVVVTGAAGFIGSTVADTLLAEGHDVLGIDCFTPYYDEARKRSNLPEDDRFEHVDVDLRSGELEPLLDGADAVIHAAAQPGVRLSWSTGFGDYVSHNVLATQRVLEAAVAVDCPRVVYASSSSVYGQAPRYPTTEDDLPAPHSPYGVTKLAAEHLCGLYAANWGLSTVSLRYFTVYGPRQRPDMAMHRLLSAGLSGEAFPLYGDGSAVRDFTFVADVVAATIAAASADVAPGAVLNVAGGAETTMSALLALAGEVVGAEIRVERHEGQPGDVARTGGSIARTTKALDWDPKVGLEEGLRAHAAWLSRSRQEGNASRRER